MKRILFLLLLMPFFGTGQIITTIAGTGVAGYSGDGGSASVAELVGPGGVCVDLNGNIYIADRSDNRIRKVDSFGIISTFAGNGVGGYSGDDAAASAAELNYPTGIAVDKVGNVYIADFNNNVVRKVNSSGIIRTIAGTGTNGYSGDGGAATLATLNNPGNVAVDRMGNVFITDYHNNCVRKIDTSGVISTIAGTGVFGYYGDSILATLAQFSYPNSVSVDSLENIYIADDNRIRKINSLGIITTVCGNGTGGYSGDGMSATSATLNNPDGVVIDNTGNIYIADEANSCIRKINSSGIITTIAGNGTAGFLGDLGTATAAELNGPYGLAVDEIGNVYIADFDNSRIRKVSLSGLSVFNLTKFTDIICLYPNPATSALTISSTEPISQVTITNLLGQVVFTNNYYKEEVQIDVSGLPNGMYFLTINGTEVRKFVKQ